MPRRHVLDIGDLLVEIVARVGGDHLAADSAAFAFAATS